MVRFLGALFIVAGTSGFGYLIAGSLSDRVAILRSLCAAIQQLDSDISFASLPLSQALRKAAEIAGGPVGAFFLDVAQAAGRHDGRIMSAIWSESLSHCRNELLLNQDEVEVLERLGTVLGSSDRDDQRKHLASALNTLTLRQQEAGEQADKTKRVWNYLGLAVGALAVIFLY